MSRKRIYPKGRTQSQINRERRATLRESGGRIITLHLEKELVEDLKFIRQRMPHLQSDTQVISEIICKAAGKESLLDVVPLDLSDQIKPD